MQRRQLWDIFCRVIDNHGDVGVCWRLAADLAARGQQVRLWVDDASALAWMAPGGARGVSVLPWARAVDPEAIASLLPSEVLVEAFGCDIPEPFLAATARPGKQPPCWINLEYLSAESYVARSHGLPSPVQGGPAAGWTKWFYYPGFTTGTGGLLRERDLAARQAAFDRPAWLAQSVPPAGLPEEGDNACLVSLFCYEPVGLKPLLDSWAGQGLNGRPVRLLVAPGRPQAAVDAVLGSIDDSASTKGLLTRHNLPWTTQPGFDELLWACDLNFVRGEDSLVRALWAGKPFVWQIYPQSDAAHLTKLDAFLDATQAPDTLRQFHHFWNVTAPAVGQRLPTIDLPAWQAHALAARAGLQAQPDLATGLLEFVAKKS